MIKIETDRLILREYRLEDTPKLFNILSNKKTMSFWPRPFTYDETESWIKQNIGRYKEYGFGRWAVILKENNQVIGDCGIMITNIKDKKEYDLGYIFHEKYWNMGLATEAARASMEYGFDKLKLNRICANMAHNHLASIAVAKKIGMKKEGEFYNKKNRDILTHLYSREISKRN